MPSSILQIRRSPEAVVSTVVPSEGELAYTTDTKKLSIGDGVTLGGNGIVMDSQLATDTLAGIVEKATTAEAKAATANKFPDAAGVKSYVDNLGLGGVRDLRSTIYSTGVPSDLYGKGTAFGIADAGELGIAGYPFDSYGTLEVGYQWSDTSGYTSAYRRFISGSTGQPREFLQTAVSPDAWDPWRLQYNQSNIVGTVSQSGGIPAGAIIETGSNANGTYTKFADGTMICRHQLLAASIACTTSDPVLGFKSPNQLWTYPVVFATIDSYQVTGVNTLAVFTGGINTTVAGYSWYSVSSSAATTRYAGLLVTGRWKL